MNEADRRQEVYVAYLAFYSRRLMGIQQPTFVEMATDQYAAAALGIFDVHQGRPPGALTDVLDSVAAMVKGLPSA